MEQLINKLKAELLKTLPGQAIQYRMAPAGRGGREPQPADSYKSSAVMILFCLDNEERWFLPLTQRFSYGGVHSGQISFPGGKPEPGDRSLRETAARECFEEIGVKDDVEVLGQLTELYIPVSGYRVEPFVGICKSRQPEFMPHEREVKKIIRLFVSELLDNSMVKRGTIELEGDQRLRIEAPYFSIDDQKIWGATAMILSELKEVIRPIF